MHRPASTSRLPFERLLLIAPFFLWGTAMVAMKSTMTQTTPFFLATVRLLPAGALILAVGLLMGRSQPRGWRNWLWILAFAVVDAACFQGFLAQGLARTDAGLGSVMIDSQPLAVAVMAHWLFGEYIGPIGVLGLILGIVGISCLGLPQAWILQGWDVISHPLAMDFSPFGTELFTHDIGTTLQILVQALFSNGQWLMLLAALSMAVGTILSRFVFRDADPVMATGWHMVLGGLPLMALSGFTEQSQWEHLTVLDWSALAYSTIFGSAIAYGLFFYFAARGNLTSLSALTFLTPVFALLFGNLFLAERLNFVQEIGVLITLISIYFINQREVLLQRGTQILSAPPSPRPEGTADSDTALDKSALNKQASDSSVPNSPALGTTLKSEKIPSLKKTP